MLMDGRRRGLVPGHGRLGRSNVAGAMVDHRNRIRDGAARGDRLDSRPLDCGD